MRLSVVILNYNVQFFLEQCIRSVQTAIRNIDAEIIVIDNHSPDDSCAMVRSVFPEITLIENKENVGFSKANNQAVAVAKGEYVCILNPDTAVSEEIFSECLKYASTIPNMGALGTYLLDGTGNFLPESKRNVPTPKASLLKLLGFVKSYYAHKVPNEATGEVAVLVGAFMFLKTEIYNEVGGFDEDYFMYGEDIDLSYKITQAGYENHYLGTSKVLHYKGESTQKDGAYLDRFYGAMHIFYGKHFQTNALFNTMVKVGVALAKVLRKKKIDKKPVLAKQPEIAYVFTENLQLLKRLSEAMEIPLKSASKAILQDSLFDNTLFIFDAEYMSYQQIFSIMKQLKNRGNQFRIRPPRASFIIGSDKSDEKGEVIVFS